MQIKNYYTFLIGKCLLEKSSIKYPEKLEFVFHLAARLFEIAQLGFGFTSIFVTWGLKDSQRKIVYIYGPISSVFIFFVVN